MRGTQRPSVLAFCFAIVFFAWASSAASAWEWLYGPAGSDDAERRVTPVPACGMWGPGYIAVGTEDSTGVDPDVYVVFTDAFGAPVFEASYDVEGFNYPDEGVAIVPVPGGYVFLSNSLNGFWSPALTFIDCLGVVIWSQVYPATTFGNHLRGNDLIRTQSGDPMFLTAPGDLAVAGVSWNAANEDAFLMRTDNAGNPIWNVAYASTPREAFHALTEALPFGTALTGDLVAVGRRSIAAGDLDGLVARVNGNTGAVGGLPQCMQHHGAAGTAEVYNSVLRLQVNFPGQFALVGTSTNNAGTGWLDDIWVTRGNTCALALQTRIGNPGGTTATSEHGRDIIEVRVGKPGAPFGSLAIAGDHGPAAGGPYDAALTLVNPVFAPIPGSSRLFGDFFGPGDESFASLAEDPAGWPVPPQGYILAGSNDWLGFDPQMYLVHDDPSALVCERPWAPVRALTAYPQTTCLRRRCRWWRAASRTGRGTCTGRPPIRSVPDRLTFRSAAAFGGPLTSTRKLPQWRPRPPHARARKNGPMSDLNRSLP